MMTQSNLSEEQSAIQKDKRTSNGVALAQLWGLYTCGVGAERYVCEEPEPSCQCTCEC